MIVQDINLSFLIYQSLTALKQSEVHVPRSISKLVMSYYSEAK
jgi:hypothetical protein